MIGIIDRIEEGIAVVEMADVFYTIELSKLPHGVKEGDALEIQIDKQNKCVNFKMIKNEMKTKNQLLMDRLLSKN